MSVLWNVCAITGNPTEVPVINKKTGHVFEKRIIEKHIESMGFSIEIFKIILNFKLRNMPYNRLRFIS